MQRPIPYKYLSVLQAPPGSQYIGYGQISGNLHCRKHNKFVQAPLKVYLDGQVYVVCPSCFEDANIKMSKPLVSDAARIGYKPFGVGAKGSLSMLCEMNACSFSPIGRCMECQRDTCQGCTAMYEDSETKDPGKGILCRECLEVHASAAGGTTKCQMSDVCESEGVNWCKSCQAQYCDSHMSRKMDTCCLGCEPQDS